VHTRARHTHRHTDTESHGDTTYIKASGGRQREKRAKEREERSPVGHSLYSTAWMERLPTTLTAAQGECAHVQTMRNRLKALPWLPWALRRLPRRLFGSAPVVRAGEPFLALESEEISQAQSAHAVDGRSTATGTAG
jgi:hypothetical protein